MMLLVVEDDRGIATLVTKKAEEAGFEVACVDCGARAIEWLSAQTPYLVILDYTLPDMTAEQLLAGLENRNIPMPPFIVVTGQGDERIAVDMMKFGARDYIVKDSVFLEMLLPVIQRVSRDIQNEIDCRRAEQERLLLERQLQHAQKLESLGVLAGGIAHDFNNLLMVILGNAELALDALAPASPVRSNINAIELATLRAASLAKQMLAYSGKGHFVIELIDVGELLEEMGHLLKVSISKRAMLTFNLANNLSRVAADATQIRQVIMNLITNASEAIGDNDGTIVLSTGEMHCDRAYLDGCSEISLACFPDRLHEGVHVYFEVADTGCGMDAVTIEKAFDPFFSTKFTGRGLGMAAVLGIVRGHKGAIKIYSEPGKGTTIRVLLPVKQAIGIEPVTMPVEDPDADWRGTGTVLIADDEESICSVGRQMLELLGFDVLVAFDGARAVEIFQQHAGKIVCVLLDLTMPHLDGIGAFREMRRIRSDVTVLLSSGYNEHDAMQCFAGQGLSGFVHKPYTLSILRDKMKEVLGSA